MTNALAVCLFCAALLCCADLSLARQTPKECTKGPEYWCQSLRTAVDCGAVGHCVADVWETDNKSVNKNAVSKKIIQLFASLKDIRELINEEYLASHVESGCRDLRLPALVRQCRENTSHMEQYLLHVLMSNTSPETMCKIVGMCDDMKVDNILDLNKMAAKDTPVIVKPRKGVMLGGAHCTWGPSYWCSNISSSHECKATHHCVERVWSKMQVAEDDDDICTICKNMVKQARDQLESNETQDELRQVFEGSCKLIPIKLVAKECMNLADQFVPDLVETLASEMNPTTVCTVAGLCNNANIDKMLEQYHEELSKKQGCDNCLTTVDFLKNKFEHTKYEDFLVSLLEMCRSTGSLSDACSMIVFKYFEEIKKTVSDGLEVNGLCYLSGQCAFQFHSHDLFVYPQRQPLEKKDELPCEFCEQLVVHLKTILVANTTETEFYKILTGLCNQTRTFKSECLSIAQEYYPVIYDFLKTELDPKTACKTIGVCGVKENVPIAPLVTKEISVKVMKPNKDDMMLNQDQLIGTDEAKSYEKNVDMPPVPLPLERMMIQLPQNKAVCSFCQYFLHYLQVELSETNNEERIKDVVDKACDRLPKSVNDECKQFVTEYGPAVIALLVQEIDPSSVCPSLGLCPQTHEVRRVSINSEKTNCPLCLFAVEQLEAMLKNNRTEQSIKSALDNLCNHLSQKLKTECVDFVDQYSNQLVEMLIADLNAQEICVYLKLCTDNVEVPLKITTPISMIEKYHEKPYLRGDRNNFKKPMLPKHLLDVGEGDIETNEIPDDTVNGRQVKPVTAKTACIVCEFVLKEIDDQIKDKKNDAEIKRIVRGVCSHMPKSVRPDCNQFVDKYADLVINLLASDLDPSQVCAEIKLCEPQHHDIAAVKEILDCAICETVVMAVKKVLNNDKTDRNIVHIVEKSCALLPAKYDDRCHTLLEIYGDSVIHLIEDFGSKEICGKIGLCAAKTGAYLKLMKEKH